MLRSSTTLSCAVLLAALAAACATEGPAPASRPCVAASLPPHAWMLERIAPDTFDVETILGPADSPETFQPSDADISRIARCKLIFAAGVPFENGPWMRALRSSANAEIVELASGASGEHDPHEWVAPTKLLDQVKIATAALIRLVPEDAGAISDRSMMLATDLIDLDRRLRQKLAPYQGRSFAVYHPAWGALADAHDLRQLAFEHEGKAPSEAEITRLRQAVKSENLTVLFVQPQTARYQAQLLADTLDVRLETIDPLAADVIANLETVADRLVQSMAESSEPRP